MSVKHLLIGIGFLATGFTYGQNDRKDSTNKKTDLPKSYFKASANYLSNRVYSGRADSALTPYITSTLSYNHKSGFNVFTSTSYDPNNHLLDLVTLGAGYDLDIIKDKLSADFDGELNFYNQNSTSITSGSVGYSEANITYSNSIASVTGGASWEFYKAGTNSFHANFELSHEFDIDGKQKGSSWTINPAFEINWGNQEFLYSYKTQKQKVILKKGKDTTVTTPNITTTGNLKFQLLDYEFSLPMSYDSKKWGIEFIPSYAIPVNPITSTTATVKTNKKTGIQTTTTKTEIESLQNKFYVEIMFYIKF